MTALRVFVVHWNQPAACAATIKNLLGQEVPLRITIIDNGSSEQNVEMIQGLSNSTLDIIRLPENLGWGPALNVALKTWLNSEQGAYCLIAAHDAKLERDCISLLMSAADRDPKIGIACPQYSDCAVPHLTVPHGVQMKFDHPRERGEVQFVDVPHGTLMLLRRECLNQIGLFDERYFAYGDEHDLGARAVRHGWKVALVWGALVDNPATTTPSDWRNYLFVRNSLLIVRVRYGAPATALRAMIILINTVRLFFQSSSDKPASAKTRIRGVFDYFRGRFGKP